MAGASTLRISTVAVVSGVAVSVVLMALSWWLQRLAFPSGSDVTPTWYAVSHSVIEPVQSFLPGLVAGWFAAGRALVHGLIVAVGVTVAMSVGVVMSFGAVPIGVGALAIVVGFFTSALTQGVGAIAGAALRNRTAAI
jgi:hypothetical protein